MAQRKPTNQTWEGFVEQQIRSAQEAGEFEHLPGAGQPLGNLHETDENWWIKRKLKEEQVDILPPLLEARRDIQRTRDELLTLSCESLVREKLRELEKRVWDAIRSPLPSPPVVVMPIDVEQEVQRWREGRALRQ